MLNKPNDDTRARAKAAGDEVPEDYVKEYARKLFEIEQRTQALCDWFEGLSRHDRRRHRKEFESRGTALALEYAAMWSDFSLQSAAEAATHH
jgi:hypothetical protein